MTEFERATLSVRKVAKRAVDFKYWILIPAMLGAATGYGLSFLERPLFEASTTVIIARLGTVGTIEPPARAAARLASPLFRQHLVRSLGFADNDWKKGREIASTLYTRTLPEAVALEIKLRAFSADQARQGIEALISLLAATHEEIGRPTNEMQRRRLQQVGERRKVLSEISTRLRGEVSTRTKTAPTANAASSDLHLAILTMALGQIEEEERHARLEEAGLTDWFNPAFSSPTMSVGGITVRHLASGTAQNTILGATIGAIVGAFAVAMVRGLRVS